MLKVNRTRNFMERSRLKKGDNGRSDEELNNDNATLMDYLFLDGSVIKVIDTSKIEIWIDTLDDRRIPINIRQSDRILDLEAKIRRKIRFHKDEHILISNGAILDCTDKKISGYNISTGSIIRIVDRINRDGDIIRSNRLETGCGNLSIKDDRNKWSCRESQCRFITQAGSCEMEDTTEVEKIKISIRTVSGLIFQLEVYAEIQIVNIGMDIASIRGLPLSKLQLSYNGVVMSFFDKFSDYGIDSTSIIDLVELGAIKIKVRTPGNNEVLVNVLHTDTIFDIKKAIQKNITENIPAIYQILKLNGNILQDDEEELSSYFIAENSIFEVSLVTKITIFIFPVDMESYGLEVQISDRIIDIKKAIMTKVGIPVKAQRLILLGSELRDNIIVANYPIGNDHSLILKPTRQGICLIINNEFFPSNPEYSTRTGTKLDEDRIIQTFKPMGYKMKVHNNIQYNGVHPIILETTHEVTNDHNILVVFVLSHGEPDGFITSDGRTYPFINFCEHLSNSNFSRLAGRPKIFYFVCCRGLSLNEAVVAADQCNIEFDGPAPAPTKYAPAVGDVFIGYATCRDYLSCRRKTSGTFYVQCLCDVIQENKYWSISDIHQEVQKIISNQLNNDPRLGDYFQMPEFTNRLRQHAYFINTD